MRNQSYLYFQRGAIAAHGGKCRREKQGFALLLSKANAFDGCNRSRVLYLGFGRKQYRKSIAGTCKNVPAILFIRLTKSILWCYLNYLTSLLLNIFTVKKRNTPETTKETIIALKAVTLSVAATVCPKSWSGI